MQENKKTLVDVRNHLFDALEGLKNGSMDIAKAMAINDVGQTLINSAKVEVDFIRATDGASSGFIQPVPALPNGITRVTQHRLRG